MNIENALNWMIYLIDMDLDYPDALYRASARFGVNYLELQDAYDQFF